MLVKDIEVIASDVAQAVVETWDLETLIEYAIEQLTIAYEDDLELLKLDAELVYS